MIEMFFWFFGVVICGLSISLAIGAFAFHKEAFISLFFDNDYLSGVGLTFVAFVFDAVSVGLFYMGYRVMEGNL